MRSILLRAGLLLSIAPTILAAQAASAIDYLERGRTFTRWLFTQQIDSLWAQRAGELPGGPDRLRNQMGTEIRLVQEQIVWRGGLRQYWRTMEVGEMDQPIVLRIVLSAEGKFAGIGANPVDRVPPIDSAGPVIRSRG